MKYLVYILESEKDGTFYIGYTSDFAKRLEYHNTGRSGFTSKKVPWKLVYTESFESKSEAIRREKFLKKQKNKEFYKRIINKV